MDDDDWYYEDETWFQVGSAETLQAPETPRPRSVSPNAHRAIQLGLAMKSAASRQPIGFHRPRVR